MHNIWVSLGYTFYSIGNKFVSINDATMQTVSDQRDHLNWPTFTTLGSYILFIFPIHLLNEGKIKYHIHQKTRTGGILYICHTLLVGFI